MVSKIRIMIKKRIDTAVLPARIAVVPVCNLLQKNSDRKIIEL